MHDFSEKAIIERIRLLRSRFAGERGKSKFARLLGLSPSTYNYYEKDRIPSIEILLKISEITDINIVWLLTGRENQNKFLTGEKSSLLKKIETLLIENPELAQSIEAFVELLCQKKGFEKDLTSKDSPSQSSRPTPRPNWIPVLGRTAAGIVHFWDEQIIPEPQQAVVELDDLVRKHIGKTILGSLGGEVSIDLQTQSLMKNITKPQISLVQVDGNDTDQVVQFVECPELQEIFPDSFALQIDGDSMSPRINDCDIVLLSPSIPAVQGHIAVARVENQIGVTCKIIRYCQEDVHLIPINEKYDTKVVEQQDLTWALAVLCHVSL